MFQIGFNGVREREENQRERRNIFRRHFFLSWIGFTLTIDLI